MNDLKFDGHDLEVKDGDLMITASRQQHTALLLASSPGHWRASPVIGVGMEKHLLSPHTERHRNALAQTIRKQMDADGLSPGIIEIDSTFNINIG
jgi:hypothetical protein